MKHLHRRSFKGDDAENKVDPPPVSNPHTKAMVLLHVACCSSAPNGNNLA